MFLTAGQDHYLWREASKNEQREFVGRHRATKQISEFGSPHLSEAESGLAGMPFTPVMGSSSTWR